MTFALALRDEKLHNGNKVSSQNSVLFSKDKKMFFGLLLVVSSYYLQQKIICHFGWE